MTALRRQLRNPGALASVLVATDFSMPADAALRRVSALPLRSGANVWLLHVLPPRVRRAGSSGADSAVRDNLAAMAQRLSAGIARHTRGVKVKALVVRGRPHDRIVAAAHAAHADLIVVGRHGQRPLADLFGLGSTADRVLRTSRVPVLIVSGESARAYRRPIVATELPPSAPVRIGARLARRIVASDARWTVLNVPEYPYVSALQLGMALPRDVASARRMVTRRALRATANVAARWFGGARFDVRVVAGDPRVLVPKIAATGRRDLLVVGTQSRRGLERLLLGSVAEAALRRARCDVLVAPARAS